MHILNENLVIVVFLRSLKYEWTIGYKNSSDYIRNQAMIMKVQD